MTEWVRYLIDRWLLRPATDYLPLRFALALASTVGWSEAVLGGRGRLVYSEIAATHGLTGGALRKVVVERCAIPYRDLVLLRRLAQGRIDLSRIPIVHRDGEEPSRLIAHRAPFIIATVHVPYYVAVLMGARCGAKAIGMLPAPTAGADAGSRRFRFRQRNLEAALVRTGAQIVALEPDARRAASGARALLDILESGPVVMAIDPPWTTGRAHLRPFCGSAAWPFPTGTVRIARAAQLPVIAAFPVLRDDGSLLIEWGHPISLARKSSYEDLTAAIDELADHLERSAGRRRAKFNFETGTDRRWNASRQAWEPRQSA